MVVVIIALLFFCSTQALAQDDFPPSGISIPCCSRGGTGGYTGAVYGKNGTSAWKQVWGAGPGNRVRIQFELRSRSAGSLHAWPKTAGADMVYLGDSNNPYERYTWNTGERSSGGNFCISCPWEFTVPPGVWNPWVYVEYWDSGDGWDIDLNVVDIQTHSVFSVLPEVSKQQYKAIGGFLLGFSGGTALVAQYPCVYSPEKFTCVVLGSASILTGLAGTALTLIDPWDDLYAYPVSPVFPSAVELGMESLAFDTGNPFLDALANDNHNLIISASAIKGYLDAANASIDRAMSCYQISAGCEEDRAAEARQFFGAANWWAANYSAPALWDLAYQYQQGGWTEYPDLFNGAAWQFYEMSNTSPW